MTEKKQENFVCLNCGKVFDLTKKPVLIGKYYSPNDKQVNACLCKECLATPFFTKDRLIQKIFKALGELIAKGN